MCLSLLLLPTQSYVASGFENVRRPFTKQIHLRVEMLKVQTQHTDH